MKHDNREQALHMRADVATATPEERVSMAMSNIGNEISPTPIDFCLTMERNDKGLLVIVKSNWLSKALSALRTTRNRAKEDDYASYEYILSIMDAGISYRGIQYSYRTYMNHPTYLTMLDIAKSNDNAIVLPDVYRSVDSLCRIRASSRTVEIGHALFFDMSDGLRIQYNCVVPEMRYEMVRKDVMNAWKKIVSNIAYTYNWHVTRRYVRPTLRYGKMKATISIKPKLIGHVIGKTIGAVTRSDAELEGYWGRRIRPEIYRDGSVSNSLAPSCDHDDGEDCECEEYNVGEICSRGEVPETIGDWIEENYPDNMDSSCGLHVHMSFGEDKLSYSKLMTPQFYEYFMRRMSEWGKQHNVNEGSRFWERMSGQNRYCANRFDALNQYWRTSKDSCRYAILNYCYGMHGTLECRVLPVFQKKQLATSAVKEIVDIVNTYLIENMDEQQYEVRMKCV